MRGRVFAAAVFLSAAMCLPAYGGEWKQDEVGKWYENSDGSYATGWLKDGESWYYLGENGYAVTRWLELDGSRYYFLTRDGRMYQSCVVNMGDGFYRFHGSGAGEWLGTTYTGWLRDELYWYYRKPNGGFVTDGWQTIDGASYYFEESHLKTGPAVIDGVTCFFDDDGVRKTGLAVYNGRPYYVNEDGSVLVNETRDVDGVTYVFDETGAGTAVIPEPEVPELAAEAENWPYKPILRAPAEDQKSESFRAADQMADQILAGITNGSMSQRQKAEAIYSWIRSNFRYSGHSATRDWGEEAYQGLRKRHGDCYTYFSVAQELLTRSGIDSIEVIRYTDNDHYWNLVCIDGTWYHFDTTPRSAGGYFCLWTDAQMLSYSRQHNNCFAFDRALYPATP